MKRMLPAGLVAGLVIILAACSGLRSPGSASPAPRMKVPVVLAALTSGTGDSADAAFAVAEVGPSGTIPHENLEGGIWVLFNKPVIALKTLEKPAASSTILSISPRIEGIYRWYGSRLLAFEPKGPLAPATEYTFNVSGSLRSLQGEALTGDTKFTFRTEPLQIVSVTPSGDDVVPEASREIVVTFNFPVDMKTVLPSVRLEVNGAPFAFKAARPVITDRAQLGPYENTDRLVVLTPAKELPWDTDVEVRVLKGAKPRPENYGTDAEISEGFHTLRPLAIEETNTSMGKVGATAELRFNHSIREDTAAANLRLADSGYKVDKNLEVSGTWVFLHNVPAGFDSTFTVDVLSGITDTYGQKLGEDSTESFDVGPAEAYVQFRDTGQKILEAQFPPKIAVEMQNVDSGRYLIGRIANPFGPPPKGASTALDTSRIARNVRHFEIFDLLPFLNDAGKGAAYLSWNFKGLFYGSDTTEELKDELTVQVTDIGASLNVGYNSLLVMASSLATGAPLQNAVVSLRKDGAIVATGTTDEKGLATVAISTGTLAGAFKGNEEKAEIEITKGKDRLVLRPSEMPGRTWNANEPYSAEEAKPLSYMWSDRGIYRPGETVSFAGIDRDLTLGKFTPVQGKFRVDLINGSEDSEPVSSVMGTVSASGSFSGQIVFPKDAEPGDWLLSFHRVQGRSDVKTGQRLHPGRQFPQGRLHRRPRPAADPGIHGRLARGPLFGFVLGGRQRDEREVELVLDSSRDVVPAAGRRALGVHLRRRGEGLGGGHGFRFRFSFRHGSDRRIAKAQRRRKGPRVQLRARRHRGGHRQAGDLEK